MSRGKEHDLPAPPLKNTEEANQNVSAELSLTAESAPGDSTIESAEEQSHATSDSNSVVDYSNPNRRIVYENSKTEESIVLETLTEMSEINTSTDHSVKEEERDTTAVRFNETPQIQEIDEPKETQKEEDVIEIVNFSDEDVSSIPAQWPQIKQESEKDIPISQSKPEAGGKSSDASFNFSDLSDISEPSAEKKFSVNFSDEDDNDDEIINAPVHLLEKSSVVPSAPAEDENDENSVDISELLDHFSNQIVKAPSSESMI
jgi:hypothetical protein